MRIQYYKETYKTHLHYSWSIHVIVYTLYFPFPFFLFQPHSFPHLHFLPTSVLHILSLFSLPISYWSSCPVPEWLLGTLNSPTLKTEAACSSKILLPTYQSETGYSRRNHIHSYCPKKYHAQCTTGLLNTQNIRNSNFKKMKQILINNSSNYKAPLWLLKKQLLINYKNNFQGC